MNTPTSNTCVLHRLEQGPWPSPAKCYSCCRSRCKCISPPVFSHPEVTYSLWHVSNTRS